MALPAHATSACSPACTPAAAAAAGCVHLSSTRHGPAVLRSASCWLQENVEKIKLNNQLPYLVSNIVEVLDVDPEEDEEEDGGCTLQCMQ